MVILGVIFAIGWTVRGGIRVLRTLFIPSSVIAGFLVLLLGPQVLGRLTGTSGLFPSAVVEVWRVMPGLMINVVFGAIMIGKYLAEAPGVVGGRLAPRSDGHIPVARPVRPWRRARAVPAHPGVRDLRPKQERCWRCRSQAGTAPSREWASRWPMQAHPNSSTWGSGWPPSA
jgi:hypothetical protein